MNSGEMTEQSGIIVDTNVVIDIISNDAEWVSWSAEVLSRYPTCFPSVPLISP